MIEKGSINTRSEERFIRRKRRKKRETKEGKRKIEKRK